jgi:hypothetical protein
MSNQLIHPGYISTDGSLNGQVLVSNGSYTSWQGSLAFGNSTVNTIVNSTVVSTGSIFYENSRTLTSSYTISTGKSAMSVGPLTINSGATVTIPSGSKWVIL